jgi:hypothetical protein
MVYDIFQKGFSFENTLKYKHNLFLTSAYYIKTIRKYKKKYIWYSFKPKTLLQSIENTKAKVFQNTP